MCVVPVLGKAAVSRSYACMAGVVRGRSSMPGNFSFMPSAGAASASSSPTETTRVTSGAAAPGRSTPARTGAAGRRPAGAVAVSRHSSGTRGRSTHRPSLASSAGSTVSEPITATATTRIEPTASEEKTTSPARNRPAIAMITAMPETTTACPEVSAAISTASRWPRALGPFLALPSHVEQRVVDADRHADQQDHAGGGVGRRHQVRGEGGQTHRRGHRRERQQHRHAGGDQRAERDDQDRQGHRQAEDLGLLEVLAEGVVERLARSTARRPPRPAAPGARPAPRRWRRAAAAPGPTAVSGSPVMVIGTQQRAAVPGRDRVADRRRPRSASAAGSAASVGGGLARRPGRARPTRAVISTFSTAGSSKLPA